MKFTESKSGDCWWWYWREDYWGEYKILGSPDLTMFTAWFEDRILGHPSTLKRAQELCREHYKRKERGEDKWKGLLWIGPGI